jgi:Sulfatase
LEGISSSESALHFIHLFLPHAPFRYYPSGVQYNDAGELAGRDDELWVEPVLANQGYQRHLLQVQMVDRMIGDLLARLKEVGLLDEAIVVVTADHGISFQPGQPRRPLVDANAYEVGMVPLFIKAPHQQRGMVDVTPSRTVDVLPTVASYLGLELPWKHAGQSLSGTKRVVPSLVVEASEGPEVRLNDIEQGLNAASTRMVSLFGTEDGSLDLYSFGDYDSLVGSASSSLGGELSELKAEVDESWRLTHVAPYTGFVPGFLHGRLVGEVEGAPYVAVALNGVVRTVVETYDQLGDQARFSAIIPDYAYESGFNDLEVFAVSGPAESPVIREVDIDGHTRFEMERAPNGRVTRLVDSEGGWWRMEERAPIFGYVDDATWQDSGLRGGGTDLHLAGWAIDPIDSKPAERVVIFVNDVFAGTAEIDRERPDIEDSYESSDVLLSGFVGRLSQFLPTANLEVRAFALSDGLAEELPVTDTALAALAAG